jgi:hypothetical protein
MVRCDTPYHPRKLRHYDALQAPKPKCSDCGWRKVGDTIPLRLSSTVIDIRLACHRGLGACIGSKFAAEGCNVAINYLTSQEQANTLATKLMNEYGIKAVTIQGVGGTREHGERSRGTDQSRDLGWRYTARLRQSDSDG